MKTNLTQQSELIVAIALCVVGIVGTLLFAALYADRKKNKANGN